MNESFGPVKPCSLEDRIYTSEYLFFKLLNATYLRFLIGPGILLNSLCLIVFSRSKLSTKSTTILFLRYLAIFDILSITLKYIRQEINHQSITKHKTIPFLTASFCQAIYVCMNTCISIAMWTIVLMSVDKAVAVSYPLKSTIWITFKRASCFWYLISLILFFANLSFIYLSGVRLSRNNQTYCGLTEDTLIVDSLTASLLPIGLITATNVFIVIILHRSSQILFNSSSFAESSPKVAKSEPSAPAPSRALLTASKENESVQALKRRTSAQITRMLLAVTLSLILFNIPNTIFLIYKTITNSVSSFFQGSCQAVTDGEIRLYKTSFYSSIAQDILSDLPHIVNFFLYCLAGKKFRTIFFDEVRQFLIKIHLLKRTQPLTRSSSSAAHATSSGTRLSTVSHARPSTAGAPRTMH